MLAQVLTPQFSYFFTTSGVSHLWSGLVLKASCRKTSKIPQQTAPPNRASHIWMSYTFGFEVPLINVLLAADAPERVCPLYLLMHIIICLYPLYRGGASSSVWKTCLVGALREKKPVRKLISPCCRPRKKIQKNREKKTQNSKGNKGDIRCNHQTTNPTKGIR